MARLSDLVQTVADATGETTASVTVIARYLREAGLITTGGRGLSAARMTSHDLASLLLAITSLGDNTKAGETVAFVGQLLLEPDAAVAHHHGKLQYIDRDLLTDEHREALGVKADQSLHDCLATQIDRYSINPEPPQIPKSPKIDRSKGGIDLALDPPFTFRGNTLPKSIAIIVGQSFWGWEASIQMQLCGGDSVSLFFSPSGQSRLLRARGGRTQKPSRRWLIELGPEVTHQAVLCLRDQAPAGLDAATASEQP